jgi:hypothetical protein
MRWRTFSLRWWLEGVVQTHGETLQTQGLCTDVRVDVRFTTVQPGMWPSLQPASVLHALQGIQYRQLQDEVWKAELQSGLPQAFLPFGGLRCLQDRVRQASM